MRTAGMRSVGELRGRMLRIHPMKGWPVPSTHTKPPLHTHISTGTHIRTCTQMHMHTHIPARAFRGEGMHLHLPLKWFRKIMIDTHLYFVYTPRGGVGWADDKAMEAKCLPPRY